MNKGNHSTPEVKHTPLPWNAHSNNNDDYIDIDSSGTRITSIPLVSVLDNEESEANAAFIVKACNSHYTLLEALKEMVNEYEIFADVPEDYKELKGSDGGENPRTLAIIKAKKIIKQNE